MVQVAGVAAGLGMMALSAVDPDRRRGRLLFVSGLGVAALAARDVLGLAGEGVAGLREIGEGIRERLSSEVEIDETADRPAEEGSALLGPPRNLLRVAGAIRYPSEGQEVRRGILERRYTVDVAVENQGTIPQRGDLELWVESGGEREIVVEPDVLLEPGAWRTFALRVPHTGVLNPFAVGATARLRWNGHGLDQVGYRVD